MGESVRTQSSTALLRPSLPAIQRGAMLNSAPLVEPACRCGRSVGFPERPLSKSWRISLPTLPGCLLVCVLRGTPHTSVAGHYRHPPPGTAPSSSCSSFASAAVGSLEAVPACCTACLALS